MLIKKATHYGNLSLSAEEMSEEKNKPENNGLSDQEILDRLTQLLHFDVKAQIIANFAHDILKAREQLLNP